MPKRGAGWIRVTHPCAGRLPKQTPRLACVKPVASVHPEPGSNSSLYNLIFVCFPRKLVVCLMLTGFNRIKAGKYYFLLLYQELLDGSYLFLYFIYTTIFILAPLRKLNWRPLYCYVCMECFQGSYARLGDSVTAFLVESECKGTAFFYTTKPFAKKFLKNFSRKTTRHWITTN